jgi:hypothetical protein
LFHAGIRGQGVHILPAANSSWPAGSPTNELAAAEAKRRHSSGKSGGRSRGCARWHRRCGLEPQHGERRAGAGGVLVATVIGAIPFDPSVILFPTATADNERFATLGGRTRQNIVAKNLTPSVQVKK